MTKAKSKSRERDGQYAFDRLRDCMCGHTFGQHTAYKGTNGKHECCEDCACTGFVSTTGAA